MNNSDSNRQINEQVRREVDRYEDMLVNGRNDCYFDEDDLLDVADYYYNDMSRPDDAVKCLDYALKLHPGSVLAKLMKADIVYFGKGECGQAWDIVNEIKDKNDPDVQYYSGLFCLAEGKLDIAARHYRKSYFGQVGDSTDMFCQIVWDYLDRGITDGIDKWFDLLPDSLKEKNNVLEAKAEYLRLCGNYSEAITIEERLVDADPYNAVYWNGLAKLYCAEGNYQKAHESVTYALDINPAGSDSLMVGGEIAYEQGEYEQAHKYYKKYLQSNDKDSLAYYCNAHVLAHLERYEEALVQLRYAQKYIDDGRVPKLELYDEFFTVYWALNDIKSAAGYLEKARAEQMSDEIYALKSLSLELKAGRGGNISKHVDRVLDICVNKQGNPTPLMFLLVTFGKHSLLKKVADEIMRRSPKNLSVCYPFLAYIGMREQRWDDFVSNLKKAVEHEPDITRQMFVGVFPEGLDVKGYYDYALDNMDKM